MDLGDREMAQEKIWKQQNSSSSEKITADYLQKEQSCQREIPVMLLQELDKYLRTIWYQNSSCIFAAEGEKGGKKVINAKMLLSFAADN